MDRARSFPAEYQDRSTYNPLFPLFIYYDLLRPSGSVGLHWHDEIELVSVLRGHVDLLYESQVIQLKKNDIAFINSSRIHGYHASDDSDVIPLVRPILINPSLLSSNGYDIVQNKYISPLLTGELNLPTVLPADDPATGSIRKLLDRIADMFSEGAYGHEIQIKACLYDLLFQLLLPSKGNWTECSVASERNKVDSERFNQVLTFIYSHFNEKIRIRDMADFMHMSEGHFSRYFKRMTQKTPIEYINEYKISEAAKLLRETDKKEIEIALDLGFDNFSYFINIFKRVVHCTPSQYRKNEQLQVQ